ncbi:MAG: CPBP family intramembrane glutamic endopeptidase [Candidatus Hadarchaeota archaeon]
MSSRLKKIGLFIGLIFLIDWLMVAVFVASGGEWNTLNAMVLATAYMFVPMVCAIAVQKYYGEAVRRPLGISFKVNRWWLVAWLLPPVIAFAALGVSLLFPDVTYSPGLEGMLERYQSVLTPEQMELIKKQIEESPVHSIWLALIQGLVAGITINAVAGFGEELGWRGFLQRELDHMDFWRASMVIGVIWGVWHAPLILQGHNYPQYPVIGVFMMIGWAVLLAPVFSYVRIKGKSVIAAAIIHGTVNATYGISIMVLKGGNELLIGVTGLAGFVVLLVVNLIIFFFDPEIKQGAVKGLLEH